MERSLANERVASSAGEAWADAVLVAVASVIHLVEAPEYWGEVRYIGDLFVAGAVGALAAAAVMLRRERWGWQLGLALVSGMAVACILSRTVGIPQFREPSLDKFLDPVRLGSLGVEVLFVLLALRVVGRTRRITSSRRADVR